MLPVTAVRRRRLAALGVGCVLSVSATSGCAQVGAVSQAAAIASPGGELVLEFDEGLAAMGEELGRIQNSGNALMRISVATRDGGALTRARGRYGFAARTPGGHARDGVGPLAALVVRPRGEDRLSPGTAPLKWGADVRLPARALTAVEGNNVLQRGLFEDPVQFKLQIDDGVPSCRVSGALGDATVEARASLRAGEWYRLHCQLRDGRLSVRVARPGRPGGTVGSAPAEVGPLDFERSTPVAVGAKLNSGGEIVADSADQYHGLLDNVFVDVG